MVRSLSFEKLRRSATIGLTASIQLTSGSRTTQAITAAEKTARANLTTSAKRYPQPEKESWRL